MTKAVRACVRACVQLGNFWHRKDRRRRVRSNTRTQTRRERKAPTSPPPPPPPPSRFECWTDRTLDALALLARLDRGPTGGRAPTHDWGLARCCLISHGHWALNLTGIELALRVGEEDGKANRGRRRAPRDWEEIRVTIRLARRMRGGVKDHSPARASRGSEHDAIPLAGRGSERCNPSLRNELGQLACDVIEWLPRSLTPP